MSHSFGHRRHLLLATVGLPGLAIALATPAAAQSTVQAPEQSILSPSIAITAPGLAPISTILQPQVVSSPGNSPTAPAGPGSSQDPNDVTGIGEMVIDQQNGFIGLCTGTLINPRTVIFASHCVNENPDETGFQDPWGYGAASGGLPIAFGFRQNNNAAGNSAFGNWLFGGYQTDVANYLYNVNQVSYNPASTELGLGNNFLQGDVAIATLDTPAANVPTWAILLSQLPVPGSINDATGTGYHVTIEGYGDSGTGDTGDTRAVDYRRRVAENYLGILGSLDDVYGYLAGQTQGLPQNLFQLDFDDPRRGTLNAAVYDVNVFKDDALPAEGITAPGDSGGPLILDNTYDQKLVIAVLSGGSSLYSPISSSFGTTSFYQPLYLFWDWIAANNNYHYVGSKAGDGKWSDPTHWVSNLDPSYMTIVNGNLVNGVPQYAGDGINGTSGKFGDICYDGPGFSDCENLTTGLETYKHDGIVETFQHAPGDDDPLNLALSSPTLDNGLPGATNFVPNDRDPDAATHTRGAYFDVTLGAAGTTTLDTDVTIDRLSVIGQSAKLNVTDTGSLTSLMDITQTGGLVNVDGTVTAKGDYLLMAGGLSGSGRINTPYLTSITGMIAPGGPGTVGTLTVGGDVILSSGNVLMVDMAGNGDTDTLAAVANANNGAEGIASIGGTVLISPVDGYVPHYSDGGTILTAEGGIDGGTFSAGSTLSAILYPKFTYGTNSVSFAIAARPYSSVVDTSSAIQSSYASLLDRSRPYYGALSELYNQLDVMPLAGIEATLESMAPRTETTRTELGVMATDNMANFYRDRLALARGGEAGGTLAMIGKPFQLAALSSSNMPLTPEVQTDAGGGMVTAPSVKLPSNVSAFIAGGYLDGHSDSMPSATAPNHDSLSGYYIAAGGEMTDDAGVVGLSFSYSDTKGRATDAQRAKGKLYQGTLYAAADLDGLTFSSQASAGLFATDTLRRLDIGSADFNLRQHDQSLAASAEVNVGKDLGHEGGLILTPKVGLRYNHLGFSKAVETGGAAALAVNRTAYDSLQGRAGIDLGGSAGMIKPRLHAAFVHDFNNQPNVFYAGFAGGGNVVAPFALASSDRNWGEVGGALRYDSGNVSFDVGVDSTIGRGDLNYRSYRGGVTFHF